MPIDPQDPTQDQAQVPPPDQTPVDWSALFPLIAHAAGAAPANPAPQVPQAAAAPSAAPDQSAQSSQAPLTPFFKQPAGQQAQTPQAKPDPAVDLASGVKAGMDPHPIDAPSTQLFNFVYGHKYMPVVKNGQVVYNSDGTPQFQAKLDETGKPIIDPKSGRPVLEESPYYVSPARKILQGILANALTMGMPAAMGHPDVMREMKKQQWDTEQQGIMEAQHWNATTNTQYMRQQQINARSAQRQQLDQDRMKMSNDQFMLKYGISKAQLALSQQRQVDYMNLQDKKMQNQQLSREEKILSAAYPQAMQQAQAQYMATHPGSTPEDAMSDPSVIADAAQRFEQMKPQAAYNGAVQKMIDSNELDGVDPSNQAALYKAALNSKTLTPEEKHDVATYLLAGMQAQHNALQKVDEGNQGKIAAATISANRPSKQMMYVPQDDGSYQAIEVRPGTSVPGTAVSGSGVNSLNVPTAVTRGAAEQGTTVELAGKHLIDVINHSRGKLGNWEATWNSLKNNSPIADPDTSYIKSLIQSFAALNPRLHGFRGSQAMQEFEKIIGGVPKNPDALIAGIQGIMDTAGAVKQAANPRAAGSQNSSTPVENWVRDPKTHKLVKQ